MPNKGSDYTKTFTGLPRPKPEPLPSPPGPPAPPMKLSTALLEYAKSQVPQTWKELGQRAEGTASTYASAWKDPFGTALKVALPRARDVANAAPGSQEQMNKIVALGLDSLGAARALRGGVGVARGVTIPDLTGMRKAVTGMEKLGPAVATTKFKSRLSPVSGREYLDAFRTNVAKGDEAGAINVVRNANRTGATMPFSPRDMMSASPYVAREVYGHIGKYLKGSQKPTIY